MHLHEKNLKAILRKDQEEFAKWVECRADEELDYVEWLLEKTEDTLDVILIEQYGLDDARNILERFTSGPAQ